MYMFFLQDHRANTMEFASTRPDRSLATARRGSRVLGARPTSMNATRIRAKTKGPVWTILGRFDAFACQVKLYVICLIWFIANVFSVPCLCGVFSFVQFDYFFFVRVERPSRSNRLLDKIIIKKTRRCKRNFYFCRGSCVIIVILLYRTP